MVALHGAAAFWSALRDTVPHIYCRARNLDNAVELLRVRLSALRERPDLHREAARVEQLLRAGLAAAGRLREARRAA